MQGIGLLTLIATIIVHIVDFLLHCKYFRIFMLFILYYYRYKFSAELIHRSTEMKCIMFLKYLQWQSMEGRENHEKLVLTNHNEVNISEVDYPH